MSKRGDVGALLSSPLLGDGAPEFLELVTLIGFPVGVRNAVIEGVTPPRRDIWETRRSLDVALTGKCE